MTAAEDTTRATAIAQTLAGFRAGRDADIATVRRWSETIVRQGNWRFSDPDGVVQDTLLKLIKLVAAGKVRDPQSFQKFVYTVTKHTCVTAYHHERSRRDHEDTVASVNDHDEPATPALGHTRLEIAERLALLSEIVQRLPAGCRQLWDAIYFRKKKPEAVAADLGITPGNLRVRVHRCTEKARTIYRDLTVVAVPSTEGSRSNG